MTQAALIRELQTMGPKFPFAAKLKEKYGIEVPAALPKYQAEYLYKYARSAELLKVDNITEYAQRKATELFTEFPWLSMKYDEVPSTTPRTPKSDTVYADGTVVFSAKYGMYDGYMGGRVVSRCKSIDKVKASLIKFHKIEVFTVLEKSQ